MRNTLPATAVQPLRMLPRDRKTLDFILSKLAACSSPERFDLLQELFEMHRTSIGFDPAVLSKARFKRFKAIEIKQVLTELEQDLAVILSSDEYSALTDSHTPTKDLFDQYLVMVEMLSAPPSKELNDQVDKFCFLLMKEGAHELLLAFYRQAQHHFEQRNGNLDGIIENYSALLSSVEFNSNYFLSGLQTIQMQKREKLGSFTQEELLLHQNALNTLKNKTADPLLHVELTSRAVKIALLFHDRIRHLQPFVSEIIATPNEEGRFSMELQIIACTFHTGTAVEERIQRLSALENSGTLADIDAIYIKLGKALLFADTGQCEKARLRLNETEHLLLRNGFRADKAKKAWIELNILRFFITCMDEMQGRHSYDVHEYNTILQSIRDVSRDSGYASPLADGLKGIVECIKRNKHNAGTCFDALPTGYANGEGNYLNILISYFAALSSEKGSKKKLALSDRQLEDLHEPFYSTSFRKTLSAFAVK